MHLLLGGEKLSVVQLGPDFLMLATAIAHPPTTAVLSWSIDGKVREKDVRLPEGISAESRRVVMATIR